MDNRIVDRPAVRLVGHAARVPLIHRSVNPHIQQHVVAVLERADDFSTATCGLWLPVEPA